jgi:hypothetical protein
MVVQRFGGIASDSSLQAVAVEVGTRVWAPLASILWVEVCGVELEALWMEECKRM